MLGRRLIEQVLTTPAPTNEHWQVRLNTVGPLGLILQVNSISPNKAFQECSANYGQMKVKRLGIEP